jgi:hypothetical protein
MKEDIKQSRLGFPQSELPLSPEQTRFDENLGEKLRDTPTTSLRQRADTGMGRCEPAVSKMHLLGIVPFTSFLKHIDLDFWVCNPSLPILVKALPLGLTSPHRDRSSLVWLNFSCEGVDIDLDDK